MVKREAVFPAGRRSLYDRNRYSAAVRSGDLLLEKLPWLVLADGLPTHVGPDYTKA